VLAAMREGALLVDIRSDRQRAADGVIPGAHFLSRNVLEWRLDPTCLIDEKQAEPAAIARLGRPWSWSDCRAVVDHLYPEMVHWL
jgi:hypothetical protein